MKKTFILSIFMVILLMLSISSFAKNSVKYGDGIIYICNIDSLWLWTSIVGAPGRPMRIDSIQFNPGAIGDICIFKNRSVTGPTFFKVGPVTTTNEKCKPYYGRHLRPVLDFASSMISSGASIIILFSD